MKHLLVFSALFLSVSAFAQQTLDIAEATLKIGGLDEEVLYHGFAEGDQLIFSFQETEGKELKSVEIQAYPALPIFQDYKTGGLSKTLRIAHTGIYVFRFTNTALTGRICHYKIQRIPATEATAKFNTQVYWRSLSANSYYIAEEKYLVSRDTNVVPVIDHKVERVHSKTSINGIGNKTTVEVTLPDHTVSWSYYLGVGNSSEEIFREAEEKAERQRRQLNGAASLICKATLYNGYAVMAGLALNGIAEFGIPKNADNIQYHFAPDARNAQLFLTNEEFSSFEQGNGPLSFKRMVQPRSGTFYVCLLNDNILYGIDVHVKVAAVTVQEVWGVREVRKFSKVGGREAYLKVLY